MSFWLDNANRERGTLPLKVRPFIIKSPHLPPDATNGFYQVKFMSNRDTVSKIVFNSNYAYNKITCEIRFCCIISNNPVKRMT